MKELIKIEEELIQVKNSNAEEDECLVIDAANVYVRNEKAVISC